jgi:hypothetical protein
MSNPTFLDFSPAQGYIGAKLDVPIFLRAQDIHGVDVATLNVSIATVPAIVNGVFQTGFEGTIINENSVPNSVSINIYQIAHFNYSQIVSVHVEINDLHGATGESDYEFLTIPDPSIQPPIVTAAPHGRLFNSAISVTLTTDVTAVVFFTLDGSTPTLYSDTYVAPLSITNQGTTTLKAIAFVSNSYSEIIIENYEIDSIAPISSAAPSGGSFFTSQEIVLSVDDPKAIIYYTINGTEPTTASLVYATPIRVRDNRRTTIKFFAIDEIGNVETTHTEIYNVEIAKNNYIPTNVFVSCPFNQSELHIRWDDMYPVYNQVIGYNIYRADSEIGPFQKLNSSTIAITQYLDKNLDSRIVNEDVSEQFRRTVSISNDVNDDFSSTEIFDAAKWDEIDPAEMLFQYDGVIFKDSVGLKQTSRLVSKYKLRGNFEIKIKFDFSTWIAPDIGIQACKFIVRKDEQNSVEISRAMSRLSEVYSSVQYVNGNQEIPTTIPSSDVTGEFRIIRVGEIITTYFFDHLTQNFIQLGVFDRYSDELHIELCGVSGDKQIEFRFSEFVVVSGNPIIIQPLNPKKEYLIYLSQRPVIDDSGKNTPTDKSEFVNVTIDGRQAYVRLLQGLEGVIELETKRQYDEVKKQWFEPPVPNEYSIVLVSYRVPSNTIDIRLRKNYFYKVTCVTSEDETDLDLLTPMVLQPDKMTYILEECVRRNAWMLEQGGERVLLYLKKKAGVKCACTYRDVKERTHKQPDQDCEICFGSGFVGGFDGPFPILIGPLTTEQRVQQTDRGLKLAYQIETWTGPSPIVNQRDMIIRRNGDRCLIGPITPVEGPGGVRAQQHFVVEVLDGTDVRHKFKVILPNQIMQPGIDKSSKHVLHGGPNVATVDSPKEREELHTSEDFVSHENSNVDHIVKGRSIVFENINY